MDQSIEAILAFAMFYKKYDLIFNTNLLFINKY